MVFSDSIKSTVQANCQLAAWISLLRKVANGCPQVFDRLLVLEPIHCVFTNAGIGPVERHCLAARII
jgi:hypothetical protein